MCSVESMTSISLFRVICESTSNRSVNNRAKELKTDNANDQTVKFGYKGRHKVTKGLKKKTFSYTQEAQL